MEKKQEVVVVNASPPDLPHDIIIAILKRLPVKTLLRFRCVCKDWNFHIKTPSFITQHLHYNTLHNDFLLLSPLLYIGRSLSLINQDLQFIQCHNVPSSTMVMHLVGSCNGLLCLSCLDYKSFMLWNPATRDILHAPPLETQHDPKYNHMITNILGFGFSATVNDYKIVKLSRYLSRDAKFVSVQVFSLSKGSWTELAEAGTTLAMNVAPRERGFNFDGAILWFGYKLNQDDVGMKYCLILNQDDVGMKYCLISFDIATQSFTLIPIPKHIDGLRDKSLTAHENKLAMLSGGVVQHNEEMLTSESYWIDLWVMEKCKDKSKDEWIWTKIYTIKPYPQCPHILRPCTLWRNQFFGEFVEVVGRTDGTNETYSVLCSHHLHTNELKIVGMGEITIGHRIQNYVESLVSLRNDHI